MRDMSRVVVIAAHPHLHGGSLANKIIVDHLSERPDLEVRDIQSLYPDFRIDIAAEQKALLAADIIVFQFPFFWYSPPAILKEWIDQVLARGFAYGSGGTKLQGKRLIISLTTGGTEAEYQPEGAIGATINDLVKPLVLTGSLAGMVMDPPLVSYDMSHIPGIHNEREAVEERARRRAEQVAGLLR